MEKRVALVTGGARGIGRAIVLQLARDGYDIAVNSRHQETVNSVIEELKEIGCTAMGLPAFCRGGPRSLRRS